LDWGADLVGIAPIERFADAPEGHRPTDFMPECKSVISIALHLHQGIADVWGEVDQKGKTVTPYLFYGYGLTNIESSRMVNRMAKRLEYMGYKSLCFLPTWTTSMYKSFDELLAGGGVRAEFSHRHAAVAAGIAQFGWNTLALTPEFGAMQRFNSILTTAELEPTPMYDGPDLCRTEDCKFHCVRKCPAGALSETEGQSLTIDGKTATYSARDDVRCMYGIHGMVEGAGSRSKIEIPEGPGRFEHFFTERHGDNMHMGDKAMLENCFGIICGDFCGKCLHQCPSKKLTAKEMKGYDLSRRNSLMNRLGFSEGSARLHHGG
jgi:epoxyqueuosine reductase QueG